MHTPGPWHFSYEDAEFFIYAPITDERTGHPTTAIAQTYHNPSAHNARLIAAAPELLEALLATLPFIEHMDDVQDLALAAIAKATE